MMKVKEPYEQKYSVKDGVFKKYVYFTNVPKHKCFRFFNLLLIYITIILITQIWFQVLNIFIFMWYSEVVSALEVLSRVYEVNAHNYNQMSNGP